MTYTCKSWIEDALDDLRKAINTSLETKDYESLTKLVTIVQELEVLIND